MYYDQRVDEECAAVCLWGGVSPLKNEEVPAVVTGTSFFLASQAIGLPVKGYEKLIFLTVIVRL